MPISLRQFCLEFFRTPTWREDSITMAPTDPSTSWLWDTPILTGINMSVSPPACLEDRLKARTGRVVRFEVYRPNVGMVPVTYTTFCANIIDTEPPPYPGGQPVGFQEFRNPLYTFTDGSKGRWERTRYPQLFDPRNPWNGFFRSPASINIDDPVHYQNVLYFWVWNSPLDPLQGGWWKLQELKLLFKKRKEIETDAKKCIQTHGTINLDSYTLPYADELKETTALKWTTFREGRDALAHTLSYIAELEAFVKWLKKAAEFTELKKTGQQLLSSPCAEGDSTLAGTWAPTITSTEEWEFLLYCRIPIYMVMEVPESHPLYATAQVGNLNNDERFRTNAFDHSLGRQNNTWQLLDWNYPLSDLELESRPEDLPVAVTTPSDETFQATSSTKSWKCPIYRDRHVDRAVNPLPFEEELRRYRERAHFTSLPPGSRILNAALDQHPLLYVIPEARSVGVTYYEEMKHESESWYWPKRLENFPLQEQENFLYRFDFELERICIVSNYSFPGRDPLLCRARIDEAFHGDPSDLIHESFVPVPRHYYHHQPTGSHDLPEYEWIPDPAGITPSLDLPPGVLCHIPYVNASPMVEIHESPIEKLRHGRQVLELNPVRPLFSPKHTGQATTRLTPWKVPISPLVYSTEGEWSGHFCYPMRLANISGDVPLKEILHLLDIHGLFDVVLYTSYYECDTTRTLDVGLRYAEDALLMWTSLRGYLCHGRYLDVYPLTSISGPVSLHTTFNSPRSVKSRLRVLSQATELYSELVPYFDPSSSIAPPLGQNLVELKRRLDQLMDVEPDQESAKIYSIRADISSAISYSGWEFDVARSVKLKLDQSINLTSFQAQILQAPEIWVNLLNPKWLHYEEVQDFKRPKTEFRRTRAHGDTESSSKGNAAFTADLRRQAHEMQWAWQNLTLPFFETRITDNRVQHLQGFWRWQDLCLDAMRRQRSRINVVYDYSSFEDVFGNLNRLRRIPAQERATFAELLQDHCA